MQPFMSCLWDNMSLIAQLTSDNEYQCISKYSSGNRTVISKNGGEPLSCLKRIKYHNTLEDAITPGIRHKMIQNGLKEDCSIIAGRPRIFN